MKRNYVYLDSATLQLRVKKCDKPTGMIIFRSYPEGIELKEFNFECINECENPWETKLIGSDLKDAIKNFHLIYPNDKILAVTE